MAAPFSWTDTINVAIGSCLPCLKPQSIALSPESEDESRQQYAHNPAINRIPRARPDELQGLLRDPESTDGEAELLSLHSNPGRQNGRRKKKNHNRKKKRTGLDGGESSGPRQITLFGYNLFGKRDTGTVRLDDDGNDAIYGDSVRRTSGATAGTNDGRDDDNEDARTAGTNSTFDYPDAAPLDPATIAALSMASSPPPPPVKVLEQVDDTTAKTAAHESHPHSPGTPSTDAISPSTPIVDEEAEAQRLHEKALRKSARRERRANREERRLADAFAANARTQLALGLDINGAEVDFEGFQGSGGVATFASAPIRSRMRADSASVSGSGSTSSTSRTGSTSRSGSGSARHRHSISYGHQQQPFGAPQGVPSPLGPGPTSFFPTPPAMSAQQDDDEEADLDGGMYASRAGRKYKAGSGNGGSDSRSRTSASRSERAELYQHQNMATTVPNSHSQLYSSVNGRSPTVAPFGAAVVGGSVHDPRGLLDRKNKTSSSTSKSRSSRTTKSHSSTTSISQSPSLASPVSPTFEPLGRNVANAGANMVSPSTVEQGLGFFDLDDDDMAHYAARKREERERKQKAQTKQRETEAKAAREEGREEGKEEAKKDIPPAAATVQKQSDFPITGFGGGNMNRKPRDYGAFLAKRNEETDGL